MHRKTCIYNTELLTCFNQTFKPSFDQRESSVTRRIVQPRSRRSFARIVLKLVIIRHVHLSLILITSLHVLFFSYSPSQLSAARGIFIVSPALGYEMKDSVNHINNLLLLLCRLIILGTSFSSDLAWESLTILLQNVSISMAQHLSMCYLPHIQ